MKTLLAAFLLLTPLAAHAQPSVLLRSDVSPREIHIGDPVTMNITVVFSSSIAPAPVAFPKTTGYFEILSTQSSAPRADKQDRLTMTHQLLLTTFSTGPITLPSMSLYFQNADGALAEAKTDEVTITVKSLLAEKGDEGNIRPLKGLFNFRSLWPLWAGIAVVVLGLLGWLVYHLRSRRVAAAPSGPPEPKLSPEEEAEQALSHLEQGTLLAEGQFKEFYSALSAILRRYVARRYALPAQEMTTSELLDAFRKAHVPTEAAYTARAFLDNADLVKFAKWTPEGDELTADVGRLRSYITSTTPQIVAAAEPESPPEGVPL